MNNFYFGVVEDRNDPLKVGRVRVRVHQLHTDNKSDIATPDLPWSQVILPTTSAGLSGFGHGHGLVEGTTVYGMFRDSEHLDFVVMGVGIGISQSGYKENEKGEIVNRSVDKGFNDPRRDTQSSYSNSVDGLNSGTDSKRPNELTLALDTSPQLPKELKIDYEGKGSTITELDASDKLKYNTSTNTSSNAVVSNDGTPVEQKDQKPYYPLEDYYDESDLNRFARGGGTYGSRDDLPVTVKLHQPNKSILTSGATKPERVGLYPFNKVHFTESGHMIEMDDSVGAERLSVSHRSGTFYEIHQDGSEVHRVVNNNYTVICKDDEVYIGGKCNVRILGDATVDIDGKAEIHSDKDMKLTSSENISIEAGKTLDLVAKEVKLNS
tara:strand:- start:7444 stop:8583 length:1140 start_codon:yes stop_codon:yes gene_type:complete